MTNAEELLSHLDPRQREVAENVTGPMAVLAGAGTGKTRAITYRIAYAVHTGQHKPTNILAVTFTHRAASEMRSRLRDLGVPTVQARTFHSAALSQLRYFWPNAIGGRVPEIKESKVNLVASAAARLGMSVDKVSVRDMAAEIEWSKVSLIAPADYERAATSQGRPEVAGYSHAEIAALIRAYEEVKAERAVIDFEDVIVILIGIMRDRPDITATIRKQYKHFVVDEYQDVSPMQHRLLQLWLGDRRDLCVVGDVSQTIYSFTGASARYLEGFTREFRGARTVKLNRDYRSTPQIVELANAVIEPDRNAASVQLVSALKSGRPVSYAEYADDADEAANIAGKILSLRESGMDFSDVAILYRTNAQSQEFETALSQAGIPYEMKGSERFFMRREVKDAMVALRAAARGGVAGELPQIVEDTLYGMGWRPEAPEAGAAKERWESHNALLTLAQEIWDKRHASVAEFVAELEERAQMGNEPTTNAVTLSSLHAAKGLEWAAVFLAGMSEGLMPISHASRPEAVAEERRLLYVGITRAREELHISYAQGNRGRSKRKVSRFLEGHWPQPESRSTRSRRANSKVAKEQWARENPDDVALFEELRLWRLAKAQETGKPAHLILHDVTLREIAVKKPRDLAELGRVRGIGTRKLTDYGFDLLAIVGDKPIGFGH
ncbi:MAG: ATP-dependent DNA helicase UvrD2 [Trueperella sp.]|uniref:ATP-dependent helicase n=1 Tax=Trueperella TaxID=1069494 RepID=UPI0025E7FED0|nr:MULTISPECIES: ATP-dependent DNA helicase UvrD2 [Trueperella]MCI7304878.1 ATP-dependent DNA helicase UvrD2 [Trueperella sp.]MDY5404331.1 ATP-dependent DNA helicase UvrD2 [Trueperella sp.]